MAGNWGKFIDRSPIICAAGKPTGDPTKTVLGYLQNYDVQSQVDTLKHGAGIYEERPPFTYKLPVLSNKHQGIYTESRSLLQPPARTRYQTLINDLKETSYDSYWHKELAKTRDALPGLPKGMDVVRTTFGKPTPRECPVKELVNPPKTAYEVLWDSQVGHDMYKKTHNDYNPSERTDRGYKTPAFDHETRYGTRTAYDPRGIWVRCACRWHNNEPLTSVNKIQAYVKQQTQHQLGECLTPNNNTECVPKGFMFGKPCRRELYGMDELLKDPACPPCLFKRDFRTWIKNLNELRINIKKRTNKFGLDLSELYNRNLFYDKGHTGWVPLGVFYHICECCGLKYEYECLAPLFEFLGVIKDGCINYKEFVALVDINKSLPEMIKINDVPESSLYYITTYLDSNCDYLKIDNTKLTVAGVPSIRFDLPRPTVPPGGCLADLENLGDDTSSGAVINPSIYTSYGLSYRDFFIPRSPGVLQEIFTKVGYQFPGDTFKQLWDLGVERDKTGLVCVDTFKRLLKEAVAPPRLVLKDNKDEC